MKPTLAVLLAAALAVFCLVGCDDSDPTAPDPTSEGPESPDEVVTAFFTALFELDSLGLDALMAQDFDYETGRNDSFVGVESLTREQTLRALNNLCIERSDPAACHYDTQSSSVTLPETWTLEGDTGRLHKGFVSVHLDYNPFTECYRPCIYGSLHFLVEDTDGPAGSLFRIRGIYDNTQKAESAIDSEPFSVLLASYLPSGLPSPRLSADRSQGTDEDVFGFDAGETTCGGLGLPAAPYRWSVDGDPVTGWTDAAIHEVSDLTPGLHTVAVEVRNSVGWAWEASEEIEVVASWPRGLDELMATFAYAHEEKDFGLVVRCLDPGFRFTAHPPAGSDEAEVFEFGDMLNATLGLFAAQPLDRFIETFEFRWDISNLYPDEGPTRSLSMNLVRPMADPLYVWGSVDMTVTERDDGQGAPYTVFSGITDATGSDPRWANITWSDLLREYLASD